MPLSDQAGFPTYWTTYGMGPRRALAIHSGLTQSSSWGPMARHLSGALTMTAFDLPGHGRSAAWDGRGDPQSAMVDIAESFLTEPADVLGHSFGATVALRLAFARPDLIRSLTLIEPVFFAVATCDDPAAAARHAAEAAPFETAMAQGDHHRAAKAFTALWGVGQPWEEIPSAARETLASQMPLIGACAQSLYEDLAGMLGPGALHRITAPVLLLEGSTSPRVISSIQAGLSMRLPQAHRAVIIGAGHMAPITHAAQVSAEVLRFLFPPAQP